MFKNAYTRTYSSIYRGIVEDNIDPENLGRCKIRVPSVHGELTYPVEILPWARPIVLSPISKERGSVHIPDKGDIVWVFFEGANRDFPVYIGGTYGIGDIEIKNDVIDFYIEKDNKISYNRSTNTYHIMIGNNSITVSPKNITIEGSVLVKGDMKVSGVIESDTDVLSNDISLISHRHGGVMLGVGSTGGPRGR